MLQKPPSTCGGLSDWCTAFLSSLNSIHMPAHVATHTGKAQSGAVSMQCSHLADGIWYWHGPTTGRIVWCAGLLLWGKGINKRSWIAKMSGLLYVFWWKIFSCRDEKFSVRASIVCGVWVCYPSTWLKDRVPVIRASFIQTWRYRKWSIQCINH